MTSVQNERKVSAARFALDLIEHEFQTDLPIGVGTGSTVDFFIDLLGPYRHRFAGAVASSERSAARLAHHGIRVLELNDIQNLPIYVDGADEVTSDLAMLKGGGGALTREKIVAAVADRFVCIVDESKLVDQLGRFPLPVEVIPMACTYVTRRVMALSDGAARIALRTTAAGQPYRTDNGNIILDVSNLSISDPPALESALDGVVGVVSNGLFAQRGADIALLGGDSGVRTILAPGQQRA